MKCHKFCRTVFKYPMVVIRNTLSHVAAHQKYSLWPSLLSTKSLFYGVKIRITLTFFQCAFHLVVLCHSSSLTLFLFSFAHPFTYFFFLLCTVSSTIFASIRMSFSPLCVHLSQTFQCLSFYRWSSNWLVCVCACIRTCTLSHLFGFCQSTYTCVYWVNRDQNFYLFTSSS